MNGGRKNSARFVLKALAAVCGEFLKAQEYGLFICAFNLPKKLLTRRRLRKVGDLRKLFRAFCGELVRLELGVERLLLARTHFDFLVIQVALARIEELFARREAFFPKRYLLFALLDRREPLGLNDLSSEFSVGNNLRRLFLRLEQFLFDIELDRAALRKADKNAEHVAENDAAHAREREHDQYYFE